MVILVISLVAGGERQGWPEELPLIATEGGADGAAEDRLDMGVIVYSCSFAVILLMILAQVCGEHARRM